MTGERAAEDADEPSFGMNALYILLLEGDTDRVLDAIASVLAAKTPKRKPSHACGKRLTIPCGRRHA